MKISDSKTKQCFNDVSVSLVFARSGYMVQTHTCDRIVQRVYWHVQQTKQSYTLVHIFYYWNNKSFSIVYVYCCGNDN